MRSATLAVCGVLLAVGPPDVRAAGLYPVSIPEFEARAGDPGWSPLSAWNTGWTRVFAGHALAGQSFVDALVPLSGVAEFDEVWTPAAWSESTVTTTDPGASLAGWQAAFVSTIGVPSLTRERRSRATLDIVNGSGLDRSALLVRRGDARSWVDVGATSDGRDAIGPLGLAGRHVWFGIAGARRGRQRLEATFAQRGTGERLVTGFGETGRGENGGLTWGWDDGVRSVQSRTSLAHAVRQSFTEPRAAATDSRREAHEFTHEWLASAPGRGLHWSGRLAWSRAHVKRIGAQAFDTRADAVWAGVSGSRPFAEGRLELGTGVGWQSALAGRSRVQWSPSLAYVAEVGNARVRVFGERLARAVWSDLEAGGPRLPFAQTSWVGGFEAGAGREDGRFARVQWLGGRTARRALLLRYPLRDLALRVGWIPDSRRHDFAIGLLEVGAQGPRFGARASTWTLRADASPDVPRQDPRWGGRVSAAAAFRLFEGDLGVRVEASAAAVGSREALSPSFGADVRLPGFVTLEAAASIALGDATLRIRGLNLENERRPLEFVDPATDALARDPGRSLRAELLWTFFD